jgi:hypothetical protein
MNLAFDNKPRVIRGMVDPGKQKKINKISDMLY